MTNLYLMDQIIDFKWYCPDCSTHKWPVFHKGLFISYSNPEHTYCTARCPNVQREVKNYWDIWNVGDDELINSIWKNKDPLMKGKEQT